MPIRGCSKRSKTGRPRTVCTVDTITQGSLKLWFSHAKQSWNQHAPVKNPVSLRFRKFFSKKGYKNIFIQQ